MTSNVTSIFIPEIAMSSTFFASVNVPLSAVSIVINIYFLFCMTFPEQGSEQLKQPLKILLGTLFGFHTVLHGCSFLWALRDFMFVSFSVLNAILSNVILDLVLFSVRSSVTSSLWLNVFYFSQIVPAQRSVFVWLKKNIKVFIYTALILDKTYNLAGLVLNCTDTIVFFSEYIKYTTGVNTTDIQQNEAAPTTAYLVMINFWVRFGFNLFNLCAMSAASWATVLYLWRHIKSMKDSTSIFSSPHVQKQMRVTITGIVQALLYFLCSAWMTLDALLRVKLPIFFDMDRHILCTVISFYSFGTTINVCVGQSMFRQRVVQLWEKYFPTF